MKKLLSLIFMFWALASFAQSKPIKYVLMDNSGQINELDIRRLNEPLLAIAAYYSALGGSECTQDSTGVNWCDLTFALGLGNQGSDKHLSLLQNWFPDDKVAQLLIAQQCYQRPSGASSFSNFEKLSLTQSGNIVTVAYKLVQYSRGDVIYIDAKDKIRIDSNHLTVIKRSIWNKRK